MSSNYSKKVDRLLESKKPSISILLEKEDTPKPSKPFSSDSSKDTNDKKKPELDFSDLDSKKDEEKNKNDDDFLEDKEKDDDVDLDKSTDKEEEDPKKKEEEEKEKAQDRAKKVMDGFNTNSDTLEDAISKVFESAFTKKMSLKNSFLMNEKRIFGLHKKLLNEDSFSDATSNIDISVNKMISNAINLTKNFIDVVDIPELVVNSIAAKFAEKAAADTDENSANEYRVKLEEFIDGYMRELVRIDDYKNYDVSAYVMKNQPKYHTSVGARPTT